MTREELIQNLDGIVTKHPKSDWSIYQRNIVDKAIEALNQEPKRSIYEFNNKEILDLIALRDRIDDAITFEDDDCPMDWNELGLLFKVLENYLESLTWSKK